MTTQPTGGADGIRRALAAAPVFTPNAPMGGPFDWEAAIDDLNQTHALVVVGDKTLVLREDTGADGRPMVGFMTVGAFGVWLGNRLFPTGKREPESLAELWLRSPRRRQYRGLVFDPTGAADGWYNLWRGYTCEPAPRYDDIERHKRHFPTFADHIRVNICRENRDLERWIWAWFAHLYQRPTERLGTALVLRGRQGTGKSKVGEVMGALLGPHYTLVDDPRYLVGQFNAHLASCLLLEVDEGFWAGDKIAEGRLKGLITSKTQMIERKGVDPVPVANLVRLLVTSNSDWVVPAGLEERRFAVLDVGELCLQDHGYFAEIDREMAAGGREHLLAYLLGFDLDQVSLRTIPPTQALFEQKIASLSPEHAWWLERLRAGTVLPSHGGWAVEVATEALYASYVAYAERLGVRRKLTDEQFMISLRKLMPAGFVRRRLCIEAADDPGAASSGAQVSRRRVWGYTLPNLAACRDTFCELARWTVEWGDDAVASHDGA